MLKSISLLIVLAALGGCTSSSLTTGSVRSAVRPSSLDTTLIGPMGRAYDCYYRGRDGGRYIAQCPSGYH
jgi:hypothetical protein